MIVPYGADDDAAATLAFAKRQEAGFISEAAMRAMQAIPSLPATEVARTSWSPN